MVGYIGSMLPLLGLGWMADYWGLERALVVFCSFMMALCLTVSFGFGRHSQVR